MKRLVMLLATASLLVGCLGGSSPRRFYYSLEYPRSEAVRVYETPRFPFVLRVRPFDAAIAYDRQEIVYRTNPYEISYYWYRLWAAKPRKMIAKLLQSHLRDSNLFTEVVQRVAGALPRYDLACEVDAIEELDSAGGEWYGRLAMHCVLTDFESSKQMWSFSFDERRRVFQREPRFVVRTLSEIMESQLDKLVAGLDEFLGTLTKIAAPPRFRDPGTPDARPKDGTETGDGDGKEGDPQEPGATLKR